VRGRTFCMVPMVNRWNWLSSLYCTCWHAHR
jgi:hypothetical protein